MQVEQVFMMWGSHQMSSAEINVPGLGTVKINDVISDETRAIIEKEAILALQMKLGITCSNLKEEQNGGDTNIQRREDESESSEGNGEAGTKEENEEG